MEVDISISKQSRPIRRLGARVILLGPEDKILLFRIIDPQQELKDFWITPGGGLKPGETYEQAALRELWEETGLSGVELGPCVWKRRHTWHWTARNLTYVSIERFYVVCTRSLLVTPTQYNNWEVEVMKECRWWCVPELREASETHIFVPRNLIELLPAVISGTLPLQPIEIGA